MFYTIDTIKSISHSLHSRSRRLVLATGFFDLLHIEHINFLKKAARAGDTLIVGVESDARAKAQKGEGRPIETQVVRAQKVREYAQYVILLPDDFDNQAAYNSLLSSVRPHYYAVSSHTSFLDNKRLLCKKYGCELVVVHTWNPSVSTTQIVSSKV